jgi:hypothetical protein
MKTKLSLELDIMLGNVEGNRKQGKPRIRWFDSIKEATGLRLEDLREAVQDRTKWRTLVLNVYLSSLMMKVPDHVYVLG